MDDKGMLRVVQARQQLQVSGDGGLNNIPIKVATKMVREVSTACGWGGRDIHSSVCNYPLFYNIRTNLTINNCSPLLLGSNPSHESGG